mgnify:CR=1 FL=1
MGEHGKVFILDDDKVFLEFYRLLLTAKGYGVFTSDNAYQFLRYAKEVLPDVMFLDVNMSKMNGWEVLFEIVNDERTKEIPIVMLTVSPDEDLAAAKGVAHFMHKPLDLLQMEDILESYIVGGRNHDVLLLEDYEPLFSGWKKAFEKKRQSCFRTHSLTAAQKYLEKNQPKKIAVRYSRERFEDMQKQFPKLSLCRLSGEPKDEV